jgi:hypothetical protein
MAFFVAYPWLAAIVGLAFIVLGKGFNRRWVLGAGIAWLAYAAYETAMHQRWLCTGECNIRVDLILIFPFLLLISAAAAFSLIRARRPQHTP